MWFAAAGDFEIAYDVLGGNGEPVVLLHDFGDSSGFWLESGAVKACLARGWQVLLVDLRGHGQSGKPADPGAYGSAECTQDVVAVLEQAGIGRASFLGYGWGGRIALAVAASAPDRVHAVAAGGCHPFAECLQLGQAPSNGPERLLTLLEARSELTAIAGPSDLILSESTVANAIRDQPDIADALTRSRVPMLLFVGKMDPRYPLALSFAERSGARVVVLADRDHDGTAAALADGQLLPRILQFLGAPERVADAEPVPTCLWSGCWA